MMRWRYNGQPAGSGWTSPASNGVFGTDYFHRAGAVKADPYDNKRNETTYFYTDDDSQSRHLVGESSYAVTFPKGQLPPVRGFWSLTVYNPEHLFAPNVLSGAFDAVAASASRSACNSRNSDSNRNAMSHSIQSRWVKDPTDRNLSTIMLRPRVIRLSLWRWRMQGSPTCLESSSNMLATQFMLTPEM
jgi:hypothetical protein